MLLLEPPVYSRLQGRVVEWVLLLTPLFSLCQCNGGSWICLTLPTHPPDVDLANLRTRTPKPLPGEADFAMRQSLLREEEWSAPKVTEQEAGP